VQPRHQVVGLVLQLLAFVVVCSTIGLLKACPHCRRKVRLSPNSATVAVVSPFSATAAARSRDLLAAFQLHANQHHVTQLLGYVGRSYVYTVRRRRLHFIVLYDMSPCMQLNAVDDHGRTALHYACMGNRPAIVKLLLAEPQLECVRDKDTYGFTPLMYAAMKSCSVAVIRFMIADGYQGNFQFSALYYLIKPAELCCQDLPFSAV